MNHEEQYSIWPQERENPPGWRDAGKSGPKAECLSYIDEVWTDMRPLSLRKQMEEAAKRPAPAAPATAGDDGPDLVTRLSTGEHPVQATLRPEQSAARPFLHHPTTSRKPVRKTRQDTETSRNTQASPDVGTPDSRDSRQSSDLTVGGGTRHQIVASRRPGGGGSAGPRGGYDGTVPWDGVRDARGDGNTQGRTGRTITGFRDPPRAPVDPRPPERRDATLDIDSGRGVFAVYRACRRAHCNVDPRNARAARCRRGVLGCSATWCTSG